MHTDVYIHLCVRVYKCVCSHGCMYHVFVCAHSIFTCVCACLYMCVFTWMYISPCVQSIPLRVRACTSVCADVCAHLCVHTDACIYLCVRVYTFVCADVCVHFYVHRCIHLCVHKYRHIHGHRHTHTKIDRDVYTCVLTDMYTCVCADDCIHACVHSCTVQEKEVSLQEILGGFEFIPGLFGMVLRGRYLYGAWPSTVLILIEFKCMVPEL